MADHTPNRSSRRARLLALPLLCFGAMLLLSACEAPRIVVVTTFADGADANPGDGVCEMTVGGGDCSLRAAIDTSNATAGATPVTISVPSGTYVLTTSGVDDTNAAGDLDVVAVAHGLVIDAQAPGARIDASGQDAAIDVRSPAVDLRGIAVTGASGPGVDVDSGKVRMYRGASFANGGAGARVASGATLNIESVTLSGNGGNGADVAGTFNASYSTITANALGGIAGAGTTNTGANVIADQVSGPDCSGTVLSNGGYNLDSDGSCGLAGSFDVTVADAELAPLSGALVPFHRPNPGSPAIDVIGTGPYCGGPNGPNDATNAARPIGPDCDRGALEANYTSVPTAVADGASIGEDGPGSNIDVLANDTDPDVGDVKTVSAVDTTGTTGSVTNNGNDVTYDPNGAFEALAVGETATDSFGYTVTDGFGNTATATVTVTVTGANDGPTATADTGSVGAAGPAIVVSVLANDTDPDTTDSLTVQSVDTTGTVGSVTNNGSDVSYDPNGQFANDPNSLLTRAAVGGTATDTFSYTATDGQGGTATATVTITVTGINHAPVANDDAAAADEDGPGVTVDVLGNDTDADGVDTKMVQSVDTTGTLGSVTNNATDVTYDPNGAFEALGSGVTTTDTFSYTVADAATATDSATVTVTVTGENDAPTAVADAGSVLEDSSAVLLTVLSNDTDPDSGDTKTVGSINTTGTLGSVTNNGSSVSYNPSGNFHWLLAGATTTDTFSYTIVDGSGATSTATVTMTITGQNDSPTAVADLASPTEDSTSFAINVLSNDLDPDSGDTKAVQSIDTTGTVGTVTNNGTNVLFTPGASYQDLQVGSTRQTTFGYTMVDGSGATSTATVTVTVSGVNDAPVAVDDGTYAGVVGNTRAVLGTTGTGPLVTLTGNVLNQNDSDVDAADTKTASLVAANSASVSVNADGSFTYTPPVGTQNTNVTFTYKVTDSQGADSNTATVTLNVVERVWYVNNTGANGDGRSSAPFNTLAGAASVDDSGDYVFLYSGGSSYTGGIALHTSEKLYGQPHGLSVPGAATGPIVAAGGSNPTVTNGAGVGVTLANDVEVQRVDVSGSSTDGVAGSAITNATIGGNMTLSNNGGAELKLTGSASGTVNVAATISNGSAGRAIEIQNRTGGTVTIAGAVTDTGGGGTGILASNNGGSTVSFTGAGPTLSTGGNAAITASGGGTVNLTSGMLAITTSSGAGLSASGGTVLSVTGAANTLSTTGGTALNVSNATIAAGGLTFRSINANGGANGIVLDTTGSLGGLTVTGNGGACTTIDPSCSGGRIQNTSGGDGATGGNGIYLKNTSNVSLANVRLNSHSNNGIVGTGVRGLSVTNSLFDGLHGTSNSGTFDESVVNLTDTGGAVSITNSNLSGGSYNMVRVENTTGTAPNLAFTFTGNTTGTMQGSTMDVRSTAVLVHAMDGTATAKIRNNNVTFWWGNAIHVLVQGTASGQADISNNTANQTSGALAGAGGIGVAGGNMTYLISGNTVNYTNGTAISADRVAFGSTMSGTISGNFVGTSGVANSGSAAGSGIFASHHGPGTTTHKITGNVVRQVNGLNAIWALSGDATGFGGSGTMNTTITGNNVQESGTTVQNAQMAILITHGTQSGPPNDTDQGCYDIGGAGAAANSITNFNMGSAAGSQNRIRVNQRFGTTSRFPGYTGAALGVTSQTDLAAYLLGRNVASNSTNANTSTGGFLNTAPAGSACAQPLTVSIP